MSRTATRCQVTHAVALRRGQVCTREEGMRAEVVRSPGPLDENPLAFVLRDNPHPGPGAEVPTGDRLGVYGFGASVHLAVQVALADGTTVHVMTRSEDARRLALDLGCGQPVTPSSSTSELAGC